MADIEIFITTLAVVSDKPPKPVSLTEVELEGILRRPFTIGESQNGTIFSSQRDQIEVIAGGNKLNIRDFSGNTIFSESIVPKVLYFFMQRTDFKVISYGINFIVTIPCVAPSEWIRDNIISDKINGKIKKKLLGGAAVLNIKADSKVWNIKLESTTTNKMNVDFNASQITNQLPDQDRLKEELQEQFDGLNKLLDNLDL